MNPLKFWLPPKLVGILIAGLFSWQGLVQPVQAQTEGNQLAMNLVFQRSLPSIVSITVRDHNGVLRRGSGFFVRNNGVFITTFGVVENAHRITVRTEDGWLHSVDEVIALSKESNLALLRAPITKTRPLEIVNTDSSINLGEAAIAIAGTEGLQWHISYGQIVPPEPPNKDNAKDKKQSQKDDLLHFSTPLLAGNQGGPLVNRYGRVMGVLLPPAPAENKTAVYTAIPAKDIHALLDKINVLPLTATWTANPPPKPKPPPLLSELDIEDDITEEDIPIVDRVEKELASALQAEEEARQKAVAAAAAKAAEEKKKQAAKKPNKEAAQHLGQVKTIAWASVPSQPDPATICPPMISQHLDGEFRLVTTADRSRADGLLSLGGRLDTGKECNMWGCFDGYRLFMHFVISNQNGKTLYREYFEVDEDDVNEACEELAEDIVDELEDILD